MFRAIHESPLQNRVRVKPVINFSLFTIHFSLKNRKFFIHILKGVNVLNLADIKIFQWLYNKRRDYLYYKLWPRFYKKYSKKPIDEKKVVLAYSELYKTMPDNLISVKNYLESNGYNCVVISKSETARLSNNFFVNEIKKCFCCKEYFEACGDAKAVFLTDYFFPAYACKPREGQKIVQLWHGCGAFKKWGYSTVDKKWGAGKDTLDKYPIHNTYTHVCVSSPKVKFAYAEAFKCSEDVVMPLGAPRTDIYFDNDFAASCRKKLIDKFPEIGERKIILYAPTFRGNNLASSYAENKLDIEKMRAELSEDYALVIKLHPLTAKAFSVDENDDFVFNASGVEIETALCAADTVITDYSSLIFEYAILGRPMIFFAYDLAEYDDSRSFYFDYETFVPGEIVTDTRAIIAEIKRLETDFDIEKVRKFKDDFMSACDGNSTRRIIETVMK